MHRLIVLMMLAPCIAYAVPISRPFYSTPDPSQPSVPGSVAMGLDANSQAWPCGAPQVVYGCAAGGGGGTVTAATVPSVPSVPADFSANAAAIPLPGLVLLATIPVNAARYACEVQNQSAATIQLVRDDGTTNASTIMLASGATTGAQGSGWSSATFKGRIRIYGAAGARVSAFQE